MANGCLFSAFRSFSKDMSRYHNIKNSRDSQTSAACAISAVKYVLFGTGFSIALIVVAAFLLGKDDAAAQIFSIVLLVAGAGGAIVSTIHGIINSFLQIALPRKLPGLLTLILTVAAFAAAVIAAIVLMPF